MTLGDLLAAALRVAGVDAVYGTPLPGVPVVPVADAGVAGLLAEAHQRVHGARAGVHAGGVLVVGPAATDMTLADVVTVADAADALALPGVLAGGGRVTVRLTADLARPVPAGTRRPAAVPAGAPAALEEEVVARVRAADRPVLLAGPGVIAAGAVPGLHAAATAARLGVLNTWGAKGVFDWRSRHHLATIGLQSGDFALGGLGDADLIVGTGLDPDESPSGRWRLSDAVIVPPGALGVLAECWRRDGAAPPAVPPLRPRLAEVTQRGWATERAPSRRTRGYGLALPPGGLLAADPGVAGYWVARTFATTPDVQVLVPGRPGSAGFAVAAVVVARLRNPGRPALAVVDDATDPAVVAALDAAARLGVAVGVEEWQPGGPALDADAHLERLRSLLLADCTEIASLGTDGDQLAEMVAVAGPVVAWT